MEHIAAIILLFGLLLNSNPAFADKEAPNKAHVTASGDGECYAKSVPAPDGYDHHKGKTDVYRVGDTKDTLVNSYDWFSRQIFLECDGVNDNDIRVIRTDPWPEGRGPSPNHIVIAFYKNGKLLKSYSTQDIAGEGKHFSASVSHYRVFEEILGVKQYLFRKRFEAITVDGRKMVFNPDTGENTEIIKIK